MTNKQLFVYLLRVSQLEDLHKHVTSADVHG